MHAESFVPYTIQVYASTVAGRGRPVSTVMFTGHGGDLITCYNTYLQLSNIIMYTQYRPSPVCHLSND